MRELRENAKDNMTQKNIRPTITWWGASHVLGGVILLAWKAFIGRLAGRSMRL